MEVGICGEHGGDPSSIKFCHGEGLSYVSASPHRIPIAIVAAAQAAIEQPKKGKIQDQIKEKITFFQMTSLKICSITSRLKIMILLI